ncbi:MAG: hypothetical protein ACM3O3_12465 [Syntrophothermus sp.]
MDKAFKLIGVVIIWIMYFIILWIFYPHNLDMQQIINNTETLEVLKTQQLIWKLSWVVPLILTVCIYFDFLCEFIIEIICIILDTDD